MSPDLQFVLAHYRTETIRQWLDHLWGTGFNHGSKLVMMLGTPLGDKPGMPDNVAGADRILKALMDEGWIVQAKSPTPSLEQRFFGVGGSPARNTWYPCQYGYEPNRQRLDSWDWIHKVEVYDPIVDALVAWDFVRAANVEADIFNSPRKVCCPGCGNLSERIGTIPSCGCYVSEEEWSEAVRLFNS